MLTFFEIPPAVCCRVCDGSIALQTSNILQTKIEKKTHPKYFCYTLPQQKKHQQKIPKPNQPPKKINPQVPKLPSYPWVFWHFIEASKKRIGHIDLCLCTDQLLRCMGSILVDAQLTWPSTPTGVPPTASYFSGLIDIGLKIAII